MVVSLHDNNRIYPLHIEFLVTKRHWHRTYLHKANRCRPVAAAQAARTLAPQIEPLPLERSV
jgi:hypothetical protein